MTLTFADTYNMIAYLNKSDASEGFNQIIDFLNGSYIEYALTVNPTIYVSCIKQFWKTVAVKSSNDITRLQALADKKKVVATKAAIWDALHLDDAEGVDCLPNEEIFTELARMGKLSTHSTIYISPALTQKVFANMKRVEKGCSGVETPLFEGMLVVREPEEHGVAEEQGNADNAAEELVTTASEDDVEVQSIPTPTPPTSPPQQPQDIPSTSQAQSPPPQPQSLTPAQPQGADFPISLLQEALDACAALARQVEHLEHDKVAKDLEIIKLKTRVKKLGRTNKVKTLKLRRLRKVGASQRVYTSDDTLMEDVSNQGRIIDELDKDEGAVLMNEREKIEEIRDNTDDAQVEGRQADIYQIDMDHAAKVLIIAAAVVHAAITKTVSAAAVVPTEESSAKTSTETKSKDKGKSIMVEEPKPMKKKQQVELDEAYARKLHEEINQDIDWEVSIDHHLEIVPDKDDDVYTEATPLARKVPVVDYQIIHFNNKPHYKIIRADGTHQLEFLMIAVFCMLDPLLFYVLPKCVLILMLCNQCRLVYLDLQLLRCLDDVFLELPSR
uniref:NADH-ubiquinone oxidoreductase chain 4 n=1 Tax=Tanacetum cinerariifolium TaxID=118510 RepID=A0A6L2JBT6_TANCI|nr:NADH-ubiquinone oxidoreductase chain 4 [Tanacetum cinerariifolium]